MPVATATKVTFHRPTLAAKAGALAKINKGSVSLDATKHIRLTADGGRAVLEATDLETWAQLTVACEGECDALIPAARLAEICSATSGSSITLTFEGDRVQIVSGAGRFRVPVMDTAHWPYRPSLTPGEPIVVSGEKLSWLAGVSFACAQEESKVQARGVWLHDAGGSLAAIGLDNPLFALRPSDVPFPDRGEEAPPIIINGSRLETAARLLANQPEVRISTSGSYVELAGDAAHVAIRLINGPFPDYKRAWPKDADKRAIFHRSELLAALREVRAVEDPNTHLLRCTFGPDALLIRATSEHGQVERSVEMETYEGETLTIGLHSGRLSSVLGECDGDSVTLHLLAPNRPVSIDSQDGSRYLVAPLRLE